MTQSVCERCKNPNWQLSRIDQGPLLCTGCREAIEQEARDKELEARKPQHDTQFKATQELREEIARQEAKRPIYFCDFLSHSKRPAVAFNPTLPGRFACAECLAAVTETAKPAEKKAARA